MRWTRLLAVAGAIAAATVVVSVALWFVAGDGFIPGLMGWALRLLAIGIVRQLTPALRGAWWNRPEQASYPSTTSWSPSPRCGEEKLS